MPDDDFSISDKRLRPTLARVSLWTADAERSVAFEDEGRVIYEAAIYDPDGAVLLVVQDIETPPKA